VIGHFPKARSTAHLGEPDDPPEDRVVPGFGHVEPCHRNRRRSGLRRLVEVPHVLLERRAPDGQSEENEGENRHGYFFSNIVENWISAGVRITIMVARKITTVGKIIFSGAFPACSSARCMRRTRIASA
jgi:hypothetical protein